VVWRPPSSPSRCSVRVLIGSVPPGRVSRVVWFNPVGLDQRVGCALCLVTSPVVGSNAHNSLCFLMLLVRLFHVEHSIAVAAGAAFAVPLP
jgi:hypothetical protein